ncbi:MULTISPECIES: glycosyl hydrolase family 28 protein [unclassified Streptomyces]|uniref:glycosyl hydrolase family 28 protein n=1 Tax=unclassified Streptomyces TaxID=2593676 RepID=UPI002E814541|nr:glycosyl hydrolase family 28 protein [Streptomyces sp. NBC_00589]WTI35379.1 glycosyl hydrolase family 28 protein [Streptomyces sp. NBC_00775]WUB30947.1 glycosyl hydrolase family 28 protein [Streptomyces sp. NBC_00589]
MTPSPSPAPSPSLSRRTALQAAGATVLAAGLSGLTATAARADDDNAAPKLVTYPRPSTMATNTSFKVRVRVAPDGEWQTLDIWRPQLEEINPNTGSGKVYNTSMVYFDFCGSAEIEITYLKGGTTKARVRPDALGITPELLGDTLRFTLDQPRDVVVQINDEIFDCLHVISNRVEHHPPAEDDPDVIYFGPGVHTVTGNVLTVPSGKTVYLAGGAVLTAQVFFKDVEKASLTGHGMLYANPGGAILCEGSKNIRVEDVIIMNPSGYAGIFGESENVHVKKARSFSSKGNGDGFDVFSSSGIVFDGCFMRNSDDCFAIYAHRWNYYGDTRDITIQNCTLWADVAHPVNIGTHGNTDAPETIENLVIKNVDILDHREPQMGYQGCIALNPGDSNLIKNVRIEDVRIEDFRWGQVIHMRIMYNTKYNTSVGRGIEDVYVKNLSYTGTHANPSLFLGYDADHAIKNVTFENLVINGVVVADSMKKPSWYYTTDSVQWFYNEHVTGLKFLTTAEAAAS